MEVDFSSSESLGASNMKGSYGVSDSWANCPLDILIMVFERLDPEDLMNCILVNECWRDAVHYIGEHRGIWQELAQAGMASKGVTFKRRSTLGWRELYMNSRLWFNLKHAYMTWSYEISEDDIRYLHVYKDILIVETGDEFFKKYYRIEKRLRNVTQRLLVASLPNYKEPNELVVADMNGSCSFDSDRMIKKIVHEGPFKRLLVIDEDCFYLLDDKNILRCSKWDFVNKRWLDYTLARYYGCNKSISDINVYNNEVYMLLKTGLVFRLDKEGRNFVPEHRFGLSQAIQFSRLLYSNVLNSVEKVSNLNIPEYNTGRNVMFHKISAVISVPGDKEFKMNVDSASNSMVLEYPGLTCAAQHGEVLFLGFEDGKVEICIPKNLVHNGGMPEVRVNVRDCHGYRDPTPEVVGIDVYEDEEKHHVIVATRFSVYRLLIMYPGYIKEWLGLRS
ncbi:uncharacterized protein LOC126366619 [Pectinophora gossypiella]|uniref:uncharacterized protein LOC126366619 n=1 Tax=Pectinophora gossypiella TaxID=13191 RepID=UPI00214E652C|nr:uncharacterized protein LOC126366619 [Pectinophora gossypiella]